MDEFQIAEAYHANLVTETKVKTIRAKDRVIVTEDGKEQSYDKILISTGAKTVMIIPHQYFLRKAFIIIHRIYSLAIEPRIASNCSINLLNPQLYTQRRRISLCLIVRKTF